jgi:hypothetical protein
VVLGTLLVSVLVSIVENEPPRPDVAILVGGLTFLLTGVLVGYKSPGRTIVEATVAGGVVGVMTALVLTIGFGLEIGAGVLATGWIAILILTTIGGTIGEILQGTIQPDARDKVGLAWSWVAVGTALGVVMNAYSVFVVKALFEPPGLVLFASFCVSFVLAGIFVGYSSPGVTILEPAVAALLMVAIDAVLILTIFHAPFPMMLVVLGWVMGFGFALLGGIVGERMQAAVEARPTPVASVSAGS